VTEEPRRHNRAFDSLVASHDDIEGLLAYAYYKRHKRAWILDFNATQARRPTPEEVLVFADGACVEDQLVRYRQQSQNALIAYASEYAEQVRPEIEKEAISARIERSAKIIEESGSLWSLVKTGFVSTLISTAILILLAIGIRLFGVDLIDAVAKLSGDS
jgi:hypothetical protein